MKLLYCTLLLLHCGIICTLESEQEKDGDIQTTSNETVSEITSIQALLDYESGLIFYKDSSISACLVEKIPESILELEESSEGSSSPTFKIPIPSEEVCIGRDNELLTTEPFLLSEPGLLFCNGLAILDITKLASLDKNPVDKQDHLRVLSRRKRQSNGYYRSYAPTGEARAQSNRNAEGQASQAQVQGQVFGSGFFSGQAQSQNSGMSQSQVQLSGVGIRGQIASSSGNAQAQLSLGSGAGSGQASGLGQGPSNSQVQVSLGQQGEESMASASATSGGARAGIGGTHGAQGDLSMGHGLQFGASGRNGGVRGGGPGHGFTPGTRFDESVSPGISQAPYGSRFNYGENIGGTGQISGHAHQIGNGHTGYDGTRPSVGGHQGHQGSAGVGQIPISGAGISDSHFPSNIARVRNGYGGGDGQYSIGQSRGSGSLPGVGIGPGSSISGGHGYNTGVPGSLYEQGTQHGSDVGGQGVSLPGTSGLYENGFSRGTTHNGAISRDRTGGNGQPVNVHGISQGQPGQIGSGLHHGTAGYGTPGTNGGIARNGFRTREVGGSVPGHGHGTEGNGRYSRPVAESNGAAYYTGGGVAGRPYSQSNTPGAYAATYGLGQAQAQTVYFGNAGNGQYIPLRYDQSSQPGGSPGIQRFQDQQVGFGNAGQRQQLNQNGGERSIGTSGYPGAGSHSGNVGITNVYQQNGLRNGHTSYNGHRNGGASQINAGQQALQPGYTGISPSNANGIHHQLRPGGSTGLTGTGVTGLTGPGLHSSGVDSRPTGTVPDETVLGGSNIGLPGGQSSTGFANVGYPSGFTDYRNGHRQTAISTTTGIRNGQATNGHTSGGGQQQVPSTTRVGQTYRINGNGQGAQVTRQPLPQTSTAGGQQTTSSGTIGQDGFSPSYGISRPSPDDPDGRKCTIITFSCTIVIESNGRAKICRPNAVKMNGNGNTSGGNGASGSKICCC